MVGEFISGHTFLKFLGAKQMKFCVWFEMVVEIGPRLVGNPQGSLSHFLHSRNSQKVGLDIIWLMQLTTFYKEMDIFVIFTHFWDQNCSKGVWLCERCLNILNHDLGCKFCAQIHIDVAELPIMKHLSFLKLANVPKIKPPRIP